MDQYSDACFRQTKGFLHLVFATICRPARVLFVIQRRTCCGIASRYYRLMKIASKTTDFGWYDQLSDFAYTEAGERCKATKLSSQVLLSFPSQRSKFRALLHFADVIARRHSQAIAWSMFRHTWTGFIQHLASYHSSSPAWAQDYAAVITPV